MINDKREKMDIHNFEKFILSYSDYFSIKKFQFIKQKLGKQVIACS